MKTGTTGGQTSKEHGPTLTPHSTKTKVYVCAWFEEEGWTGNLTLKVTWWREWQTIYWKINQPCVWQTLGAHTPWKRGESRNLQIWIIFKILSVFCNNFTLLQLSCQHSWCGPLTHFWSDLHEQFCKNAVGSLNISVILKDKHFVKYISQSAVF